MFPGWEVTELALHLMQVLMPTGMSARDLVSALRSVPNELLPAIGARADWRIEAETRRS